MAEDAFVDGWTVRRHPDGAEQAVVLPHDAMLEAGRDAHAPSGFHGGYFRGGRYLYRKLWHAPAGFAGRAVTLVFEGAYRHSRVRVNGREMGGATDGFVEFEVPVQEALRFGETNEIEVEVENEHLPAARWYTGSGLYRPVWLRVDEAVHLLRDGLRVRTLSAQADEARVLVELELANPDGAALAIEVALHRDGIEAARATASTTGGRAELALAVADPALWSADHPALYRCSVRVSGDGIGLERSVRVGLRTIAVDGRHGLRVNGVPVLLRGGNIHHDNGVLGAATFDAAERRRVRILKQNGFNAIRSAHNPCSRALLDACDEIGLYVMDELYDNWYDHKTEHDDADAFDATWQATVDATIGKNRNHPSVILLSIGNENSEPATAYGLTVTRRLAARARERDPDRPVTIGVNMMAAALGWPERRKGDPHIRPASRRAAPMDSTMVNAITNQFGWLMRVAPRLRRTGAVTRPVFDQVDVAGYNYGFVRYAADSVRDPDRAIVGTETVPGAIPEVWKLVEALPGVIGDFAWAGWDYLGEAGIGSWEYGKGRRRLWKPWPQLTAGVGMIDLIGQPDTPMLLAGIVWGTRTAPVIAVRPPHLAHLRARRTAWRSTDAVASWSWRGCENRMARFEILSAASSVELLVNGRSLGRRAAGPARGFLARFAHPYEPGEVVAVAYDGTGRETGRSVLRSAGRVALRAWPDRDVIRADGQDLAFVTLALADEDGIVEMMEDDVVRVSVEGAATLAGLGSAAPATGDSFTDAVHPTWRGRALAVIRAGTRAGTATVSIRSERHGDASVTIRLAGDDPASRSA